MIVATVPVAFYTDGHIGMTERFLSALMDEGLDAVTVYHNGGPLARPGLKMLRWFAVDVVTATGWPIYRMWNEGIQRHPDAVCLVLNNDIEWDQGALAALGEKLAAAEDEVAIVSPSPGGEPRWAFAIRPRLAVPIDERYQTWYGDTELETALKAKGYRLEHFDPGIRHPHIQTTTDQIPDIAEKRRQDQVLFEMKWGAP